MVAMFDIEYIQKKTVKRRDSIKTTEDFGHLSISRETSIEKGAEIW